MKAKLSSGKWVSCFIKNGTYYAVKTYGVVGCRVVRALKDVEIKQVVL